MMKENSHGDEFKLTDTLIVLVLLTLGLVQLAFGGVFVWSYSRMTAALLGLAIITMLVRFVRLFIDAKPMALPGPVFLLPFVFLFLGFTQVIPLPPGLVGILSPERLLQVDQLAGIGAVDPHSWITLSIAPHTTWLWMARLASYITAFVLVVYSVRSRKRAIAIILVLAGFALFQIFYGSVQAYSHTPRIWWWVKDLHESFVSGTYFNRNHLAGFLEIVLPLWLGFTFWMVHLHAMRKLPKKVVEAAEKSRHRRRRVKADSPRYYSWRKIGLRQKLVSLASRLERQARPAACYTVGAVLFVGLLLTGSRGGILAFIASLIVMGVLMLFFKKFNVRVKALAVLVGFSLVLGLFIGMEQTMERFEQEEGLYHRIAISRSVLPTVGDYAVTGAGLGNFRQPYLAHSLPRYGGRIELIYAHNDWLQIAVEAGIPGMILSAAGFFALLFWGFRRWRRRHDIFILGVGLGLLAGIISLGLHSLTDFNMQIPANAMTFAIAIGLLAAVLTMRHTKNGLAPGFWEQGIIVQSRFNAMVLLLIGIVVAGVLLDKSMSHAIAENICATERNPMKRVTHPCGFDEVFKALDVDPADPSLWARLGAIYQEQQGQSRALRALHAKKAVKAYTESLVRQPVNGRSWLYLGESRLKLFVVTGDFTDLELAEEAFAVALQQRPNDAQLLSRLAEHRLWLARIMPPGPLSRNLKNDGIFFAKRSLQCWRWDWRQVVPMVLLYTQDPEDLKQIVPDHEDPGRKIVRYLEKRDIHFPPGTFAWEKEESGA